MRAKCTFILLIKLLRFVPDFVHFGKGHVLEVAALLYGLFLEIAETVLELAVRAFEGGIRIYTV